jgi:hypothetical protein
MVLTVFSDVKSAPEVTRGARARPSPVQIVTIRTLIESNPWHWKSSLKKLGLGTG